MRRNPPAVHYLDRSHSPAKIACGRGVRYPREYTSDYRKASCYDCARWAEGLSAVQRDEIWQNANERMNAYRGSPWVGCGRMATKAS